MKTLSQPHLFSSPEYFAGAKFLSTHLFMGSVDDEKGYGFDEFSVGWYNSEEK